MVFTPNLSILPPSELRLWPELDATPEHFTPYGGTALALRLGHRASVDFDFSSKRPFDPDELAQSIPYLKGAERVQVAPLTLKCPIERDGPVLVSFLVHPVNEYLQDEKERYLSAVNSPCGGFLTFLPSSGRFSS